MSSTFLFFYDKGGLFCFIFNSPLIMWRIQWCYSECWWRPLMVLIYCYNIWEHLLRNWGKQKNILNNNNNIYYHYYFNTFYATDIKFQISFFSVLKQRKDIYLPIQFIWPSIKIQYSTHSWICIRRKEWMKRVLFMLS